MNWFKKLIGQAPPTQEEQAGALASTPAPGAVQELTLRDGSPEFHLFVAGASLDAGTDLAHGASHLATLLEVDPRRADWQALAARYLDAAGGNVEALLPVGAERFVNSEALRAWFWQRQGKVPAAVDLLLQVARAAGHARYLHAWALDWLERDGALAGVDEATMMQLLATVLNSVEEAHESSAATVRDVGRWAALAGRASAAYAPTPIVLLVRAGLHRKAGQFDAGLALTGPIDRAGSAEQANAIGLLLRCMRRFDESEQAFIHANSFDPDDITPKLEAGDTCFEAGNWHKALAWYQAVLAVADQQAWALASSWYCRYKLDGDQACFERLWEAMNGGDSRAHQLVFRERGQLAQSSDASANVLRQMRQAWLASDAGDSGGGAVKIEVNTLEAPSNRLAFALEFAARKPPVALTIECGPLPAVDPRLALAPVDHPLWAYQGTVPYPALAAPAAAVRDAVAALALAPYHPHLNWAQASHVAARFGTPHVRDLLATMVYPPPLPQGVAALAWLPRVQLAAAQVLAQLDSGWEGSARRSALLSVLFGPMDWSTCAAIRVLAHIGATEAAHGSDIMRLFAQMEKHIPEVGHWDWVALLYQQWLELPCLFDTEREELRRKLAAYSGDAADGGAADG
jgi:tetratricopeptide (TPR) repeat protein